MRSTATASSTPSSPADRSPSTPRPDISNFIRPATHLLQPEPPLSHSESASVPPPSYTVENDIPPPPFSSSLSHSHSNSLSTPTLPLPAYTPSSATEPHTLPRSLFFWGFLFPLSWVVGLVILCVPLRVIDEDWEESFERDVERGEIRSGEEEEIKKRERELLDEKVVILRKAEIRWGTRCAIALGTFMTIVGFSVALALYFTRR